MEDDKNHFKVLWVDIKGRHAFLSLLTLVTVPQHGFLIKFGEKSPQNLCTVLYFFHRTKPSNRKKSPHLMEKLSHLTVITHLLFQESCIYCVKQWKISSLGKTIFFNTDYRNKTIFYTSVCVRVFFWFALRVIYFAEFLSPTEPQLRK